MRKVSKPTAPAHETPTSDTHDAQAPQPTAQHRRQFLHRIAGVAVAVGGGTWLAGCGGAETAATNATDPQVGDSGAGEDIHADAQTSDALLTDAGLDGATSDGGALDAGEQVDAKRAQDTTLADGESVDSSDANGADDGATTGADTCSTDAQGSAPQPCAATGADLEGPYYEPKASATTVLAGPKEPGDRLKVSGSVFAHGCTKTVAGATVEVWHADAAGQYRDLTHATSLRATLTTDCNGAYGFDTILPGAYLDAGGYRPRHIHFRVTTPSGKVLITQLYFAGDPYLSPNDSCGSCKSDDASHIIQLNPIGGVKTNQQGVFHIVM